MTTKSRGPRVTTDTRPSGINLGKAKSPTKLHANAVVTMPEHVKVQKLPGCDVESRFKFNPPEGWKGQITQDWLDRRLASA